MEFRLDDGQVELQQTVARFCDDRFPLDSVVAREGRPVDRVRWNEMAALGIFGLLDDGPGGSGLGVLEGALLFEQLGSHLAPGPVLWTVLGAPLVDGASAGDVVVGGVTADAVVDGSALVEHAADLDVLLVVHDDRVVAHRDLGAIHALDPLDPLTPVGRVWGLDGGEVVGDASAAVTVRLLGIVLGAATLAGLASRSLEVAAAYALGREQFGAPIGSFQAVKHLLADMHVRSGLAQSATYAAAAMADSTGSNGAGGDDPLPAARAAKLLAADAAVENAGTAIQVLGGMGFTWDMLPNHLLKRAWVVAQSFGTADDHAQQIGADLVAAHR